MTPVTPYPSLYPSRFTRQAHPLPQCGAESYVNYYNDEWKFDGHCRLWIGHPGMHCPPWCKERHEWWRPPVIHPDDIERKHRMLGRPIPKYIDRNKDPLTGRR